MVKTASGLGHQRFRDLARTLSERGFCGEIISGVAGRAAMSTDNSVYQIVPDLVLAPRNADDLALAMQVLGLPDFSDIPVTGRGGGTGTNGQALNRGVVVDFRRFMNRVLHLNLKEGWVDVEPGIVLDSLNEYLAPHGVFFAPTTSTASRCTIGGMIGTDAAGKGSHVYGKTGDHTISLNLMLSGGEMIDTETFQVSHPELADEISAACADALPEFVTRIPKLPRRFSGYDLYGTLPEHGMLHLHRLIVGAESTLGLVTRARLKLTPRPAFTQLVLVAFSSLDAALRASASILGHNPVAIEILDERTQDRASAAGMLDHLPEKLRQPGTSCAFVEFSANNEDALDEQIRRFIDDLPRLSGATAHHLATQPQEIAQFWSVRAAAVGLLAKSREGVEPVSGIEDCAVAPDRLADFVADFRSLLARHGLECGIYGHADVGCIHIRPLLNLETEAASDAYAALSRDVYELTLRHGGIFWGEHGKGVRGEYLKDFAGETVFQSFLRIKRAFDPKNRFNPGKLVRLDSQPMTVRKTPFRQIASGKDNGFDHAFACNGNAACLSQSSRQAMCPSFKATGDVRHSPKGRAEALKAWQAADLDQKIEMADEVFSILDGCLGCKACASSCPVRIDIPELKSRFLEDHYKRSRRPVRDHAVIALERFAPFIDRLRVIAGLLSMSGIPDLCAGIMGYVDLPAFDLSTRLNRIAPLATEDVVDALPETANPVIVVVDPFCGLFDLQAVSDICGGFRELGYTPLLSPILSGGKSAHVKGARETFRKVARRTQEQLEKLCSLGLPLIGTDPAFVLMLRFEYRNIGLHDISKVQLADEFLIERLDAGDTWPQFRSGKIIVLRHCTEASVTGPANDNWLRIFSALGMDCEVPEIGCCGMSGLYGHEKRHVETSRALFDMSWREHVEPCIQLAATGFSCRCQTKRLTQLTASHPLAFVKPEFHIQQ